ncbi:MAG TPA: YciI family protein [Bryobacteraceae bacterium]|nr:YciI family protein [Bryobacteraceae bacterium]
MPRYMLLLHSDPANWRNLSPEEMQKAIEKYTAWVKKSVDSQRLTEDAGKVIRRQGGQTRATDGPYSETKEILGGYYTIEAANYDEAVKLALSHPHLDYGGTIEVRQVWAM